MNIQPNVKKVAANVLGEDQFQTSLISLQVTVYESWQLISQKNQMPNRQPLPV